MSGTINFCALYLRSLMAKSLEPTYEDPDVDNNNTFTGPERRHARTNKPDEHD